MTKSSEGTQGSLRTQSVRARGGAVGPAPACNSIPETDRGTDRFIKSLEPEGSQPSTDDCESAATTNAPQDPRQVAAIEEMLRKQREAMGFT